MIGARISASLSAGSINTADALIAAGLVRLWCDDTATQDADAWAGHVGTSNDLIRADGTAAFGMRSGKVTRVFDGSTYFAAPFASDQPCERWFTFARTGAYVSDQTVVDGEDATAAITLGTLLSKDTIEAGAGSVIYEDGIFLNDAWTLVRWVMNGASSELWHNGVLVASGDCGANDPEGIIVGATAAGTEGFTGAIGEVVVTNPLNAAWARRLTQYLTGKWATG